MDAGDLEVLEGGEVRRQQVRELEQPRPPKLLGRGVSEQRVQAGRTFGGDVQAEAAQAPREGGQAGERSGAGFVAAQVA